MSGGKGEPAVSLGWAYSESMALQRHVVLGAAGGTGSAVVRELAARKLPVRAVTRGDIVDLPDDVEHVPADVGTIEGARRACHGAAVVYHCVQPDYTKWAELFPPFFAHRVCRSGRSPERRTRRSWTPRRALVIVAGIVERIACASRDRTEPQRLTTAPNDRSMRDRGRSERHLSTGRRCQAGRWRSDSAAERRIRLIEYPPRRCGVFVPSRDPDGRAHEPSAGRCRRLGFRTRCLPSGLAVAWLERGVNAQTPSCNQTCRPRSSTRSTKGASR